MIKRFRNHGNLIADREQRRADNLHNTNLSSVAYLFLSMRLQEGYLSEYLQDYPEAGCTYVATFVDNYNLVRATSPIQLITSDIVR